VLLLRDDQPQQFVAAQRREVLRDRQSVNCKPLRQRLPAEPLINYEQLLALAQNLQDPGLLARAHSMLGELLYFMGEFTQNRAHVEQAITLYDPLRHRSQIFLYGNDTGVGSRINVARALWTLGYPDQALNRLIEALTLAQELAHPFNLAMTLHVAAWIH